MESHARGSNYVVTERITPNFVYAYLGRNSTRRQDLVRFALALVFLYRILQRLLDILGIIVLPDQEFVSGVCFVS